MIGLIAALVTVLAWGSWLAPSQRVPMRGQQTRTVYVTVAALLMALPVSFVKGFAGLNARTFLLPFLGGLIWAVSALAAFVGTNRLGMAKATGIWAPLNIVVAIAWGIVLFGEFLKTGALNIALAVASLALIIVGILMIVLPSDTGDPAQRVSRQAWIAGFTGALVAGVGFACYLIPIRISQMSAWVAMTPLAVGMFVGSALLAAISRSSLRLEQPSHYARVLATGVLWSIGNYGALIMMERIGTGKGFTIAQLGVVVNALLGVFWEHKPMPGTRAARLTLAGVAIATVGGVLLGNLK